MHFKDVSEGGGLSSNNFIKLEDKGTVRGIFRGDPFDFRQHWVNGRSVPCLGTGCPECSKGDRPKFRFRINFIVREADGSYSAKIFEHGAVFYNTLKSLHESGYNLEKTIVSVTRNGRDKNTTYTIIPAPNGAVDDALEKKLQNLKLNDLSNFKKTESEDSASSSEFDDIPF